MTRINISDGSPWPRPALESDDENGPEWLLRYAPQNMTRGDQLQAAAIINAYGHLVVEATEKKVRLVRREIREHLLGEADQ